MSKPITAALDARLYSTQNTGDTSYWRGLIKGFAELDTDFNLLLFSNAKAPSDVPNDPRFQWIFLPGDNLRWWSLYSFPKAAAALSADVTHGQYIMSPIIRMPMVTTIHDVSFMVEPKWFKRKDAYLLRNQVPATIRRSKLVITVSETSKSEIESYFPGSVGKVRVTYNALGHNIRPMIQEQAVEMVKSRLDIEPPFMLTLGHIWPRKNMNLAIESAGMLPESLPHRLVVAGKSGWGDIQKNARTTFTGYVEDELLSALYCCADLYLAPSLHEGFGIPLIEAFSCGCPVLSSAGGALPEVAGNAAEIAPDYEPSTWANLIQSILTDGQKLDQMRKLGYERAKDFSWKSTAGKTLAIYEEACQ